MEVCTSKYLKVLFTLNKCFGNINVLFERRIISNSVLSAGMDRELAEEFIEQTMEPSSTTITVTADHHTVSGTESEAW